MTSKFDIKQKYREKCNKCGKFSNYYGGNPEDGHIYCRDCAKKIGLLNNDENIKEKK